MPDPQITSWENTTIAKTHIKEFVSKGQEVSLINNKWNTHRPSWQQATGEKNDVLPRRLFSNTSTAMAKSTCGRQRGGGEGGNKTAHGQRRVHTHESNFQTKTNIVFTHRCKRSKPRAKEEREHHAKRKGRDKHHGDRHHHLNHSADVDKDFSLPSPNVRQPTANTGGKDRTDDDRDKDQRDEGGGIPPGERYPILDKVSE